jgi:hypothetical protein
MLLFLISMALLPLQLPNSSHFFQKLEIQETIFAVDFNVLVCALILSKAHTFQKFETQETLSCMKKDGSDKGIQF